MKRVMAITPPDARYGFGLAGIAQYAAQEEATLDLLKKTVADPDNGVIIIDERLVREVGDDVLKDLERSWQGVIVVLPQPAPPSADEEDYALRLIRKAIGYHVRIRL